VHEREPHAERRQQIEIDREFAEAPVGDEVATERDDESLAAEGVDVRCGRLKPVDEPVLCRKPQAARRPLL
jgi:hypothetical protein